MFNLHKRRSLFLFAVTLALLNFPTALAQKEKEDKDKNDKNNKKDLKAALDNTKCIATAGPTYCSLLDKCCEDQGLTCHSFIGCYHSPRRIDQPCTLPPKHSNGTLVEGWECTGDACCDEGLVCIGPAIRPGSGKCRPKGDSNVVTLNYNVLPTNSEEAANEDVKVEAGSPVETSEAPTDSSPTDDEATLVAEGEENNNNTVEEDATLAAEEEEDTSSTVSETQDGQQEQNDEEDSVVRICPQDTKICDSFVFVGRDPRLNCEFRPCPTTSELGIGGGSANVNKPDENAPMESSGNAEFDALLSSMKNDDKDAYCVDDLAFLGVCEKWESINTYCTGDCQLTDSKNNLNKDTCVVSQKLKAGWTRCKCTVAGRKYKIGMACEPPIEEAPEETEQQEVTEEAATVATEDETPAIEETEATEGSNPTEDTNEVVDPASVEAVEEDQASDSDTSDQNSTGTSQQEDTTDTTEANETTNGSPATDEPGVESIADKATRPAQAPTRFYAQKSCIPAVYQNGRCSVYEDSSCRGDCKYSDYKDDNGRQKCLIQQAGADPAGCGCSGEAIAEVEKCTCKINRLVYEVGKTCVGVGSSSVQFVNSEEEIVKEEENDGARQRKHLRG